MGLESRWFGEMIRCTCSPDAWQRQQGADQAADWVGGYSAEDGRTLVAVLVLCAVAETDLAVLEARLHCLFELGPGRARGPGAWGGFGGSVGRKCRRICGRIPTVCWRSRSGGRGPGAAAVERCGSRYRFDSA